MDIEQSISDATLTGTVRIQEFDLVVEYLRAINKMRLDDMVLMDGNGQRIIFDCDLLNDWKFMGLDNKDFLQHRQWECESSSNRQNRTNNN